MARHGRAFVHRPVVARYPGNTIAPTYSVAAAVSAVTSSTVNVGFTATDDLAGGITSYLQLYAAGSTPTNDEVVTGTGTGLVAGKLDSSFTASGAPAAFAQLTGLSNGHPYRAAIAIRDGYNNFAAVTYVDFWTTVGQASRGELDVTGFAGALANAKTVTVPQPLSSRAGVVRASLSALHWSWFDSDDPGTFGAPTDQGIAETTDGSGVLAVALSNSVLSSGQFGRLVVESSDKTMAAVYRLAIP